MIHGIDTLTAFLEEHRLGYQRFDHPPLMTCAEARTILLNVPGVGTKNLFLRDGKGKRHLLVSVREDKDVDLKPLGELL